MSAKERTRVRSGRCIEKNLLGAVVLLLCLIAAFHAAPVRAAVLVMPAQGTNLEQSELAAIWQLVAAAYQAERRDTLIPADDVEAALQEVKAAPAAAARLGVGEYVQVAGVRLRERIVLTASLHEAGGKLLHTAKITASTMDDVEPASERLVKALLLRTETARTRNLETVTMTETKPKNRAEAQRSWGLRAAYTYPVAYGPAIASILDIGFNARYESSRHFVEIGAGIMIPEAADQRLAYGGAYGDLGASWYLTQSDIAPYLGGGVMPRLASASIINVAPYAQAGLTFFRESTTRMYMELRVAQNVLPVGFDRDGAFNPDTGSSDAGRQRRLYPTEFCLAVGASF
jgi:hypothetical protein